MRGLAPRKCVGKPVGPRLRSTATATQWWACRSAGGVDEGSLTFEPCSRFVDEWVSVSEPEIARGMIGVLEHEGERIEGAQYQRMMCCVEKYVNQHFARDSQ